MEKYNNTIWSAHQLSQALGTAVDHAIIAGAVQFNSKDVRNGDLFIALKGNSDGHIYVEDAFKRGAAVAIVSHNVNVAASKIITVGNTMAALYKLAEYKRQNSTAKFVGITGSTGKTSTKDAMKTMLSAFGKTYATRGNFNNYLGLPISLASQPDDTEYAVYEIGMSHAGEIRELAKLLRPDIAVITSVSEAHLEFFNSVTDIVDAKCEIFEGLANDGAMIVNADSKYYDHIMLNIARLGLDAQSVHGFGMSRSAHSMLKSYEKSGSNVHLEYMVNNIEVKIILPFIPEHFAQNFAAILMLVSLLKLDVNFAAQQLRLIRPTEGRGEIIKVAKGVKRYTLLCDYYNANPKSLKASLSHLKHLDNNKKVAVLGDMLELGHCALELHKSMIQAIIDSGVQKVILVGAIMQQIKNLLPCAIESVSFDNVDLLYQELDNLIEDGELILIKGSKAMRLEKIIDYFDQMETDSAV